MVKLQRRVVLSGEDSQEDMRREDSSSNGIGGHVSSSYFRENEMDQLLTPKPEVDLDLQTSWQRKGNTYAVVLLCIVGAVLAADQNLMAPNLTQIAGDLRMTPEERDSKLAGWTAAIFFLVGAPASLLAGWADPIVDRVKLLSLVVLFGEGPLMLMLFVTEYWQLLAIRVCTGIAVGGTLPLVFSILSDLYPSSHRSFVSSLAMVSNGVGLVIGQGIAGVLGPVLGWRIPFAIVGANCVFFAFVMAMTLSDPPRGAMDGISVERVALSPSARPDTRPGTSRAPNRARPGANRPADAITTRGSSSALSSPQGAAASVSTAERLWHTWSIPSNALIFLQGVPGSLPWGMVMVFFSDYLAQDKGLGVAQATLILMLFGIGGGVGTVLGGVIGQALYNRRKEYMVLFFSGGVVAGVLPVLYLILVDLASQPLLVPCVLAAVAGTVVVIAGPNIRAQIMNVNGPDTIGLALALHATLDDVGRGLGPALVAPMVAVMGRQTAFVVATLAWLPCAAMLFSLVFTVRRDEKRKRIAIERAGLDCKDRMHVMHV